MSNKYVMLILRIIQIVLISVLISGIISSFLFFEETDEVIEYVPQYGYDNIECYYNSHNDYKLTCYDKESTYEVVVFYISYIAIFLITTKMIYLLKNNNKSKFIKNIKHISIIILVLSILKKSIILFLIFILLTIIINFFNKNT